jgi:hypothetical protein
MRDSSPANTVADTTLANVSALAPGLSREDPANPSIFKQDC